jgi:hypothetical protein
MDKDTLLRTLHTEREGFEALLKAIGPERMTQPGVDGDYSVKDIVAHLTAYQRWLADWLAAALRGTLPPPSAMEDADVEARNVLFFALNQDRPLEDVLAESRAVHANLVELIGQVPETDFDDPRRTDWCVVPYWKSSRPLWQALLNDSVEHFHQHRPALEAWQLAGQPRAAERPRPAWTPRLPRLSRAPRPGDSGD